MDERGCDLRKSPPPHGGGENGSRVVRRLRVLLRRQGCAHHSTLFRSAAGATGARGSGINSLDFLLAPPPTSCPTDLNVAKFGVRHEATAKEDGMTDAGAEGDHDNDPARPSPAPMFIAAMPGASASVSM